MRYVIKINRVFFVTRPKEQTVDYFNCCKEVEKILNSEVNPENFRYLIAEKHIGIDKLRNVLIKILSDFYWKPKPEDFKFTISCSKIDEEGFFRFDYFIPENEEYDLIFPAKEKNVL